MIDIHCHILPGLDDGSQHLEESIEMAKAAVQDGVNIVIATPHHANGRHDNEAAAVQEAVQSFKEELERQNIPLQVLWGQEIRVYDQLVNDLYRDLLLPLHVSRYMLLEFPTDRIPEGMDELIHELQVLELIPIIAHPERNREIADQPDKLYTLVQQGALAQVTSHSLTGLFGNKIQELSLELCRRHLIHFVASDAHNLIQRPFGLSGAYELVREQIGDEYTRYYQDNAQKIVNKQLVDPWEPVAPRKKWYAFWKSS